MPYFITDESPDCSTWAVVKDDGEQLGCHATKQDAIDQMVALSIAEDIEPGGERIKKKKNMKKPTYRAPVDSADKQKRDEVQSPGGGLPDHYRPATSPDVPDGRACGNCFYFNENDVAPDGRARCMQWGEYVSGGFVCNAWKSRDADEARQESEPAPKKEQIVGSDTNKPGSAAGAGGEITFDEKTETSLRNKVKDHNDKMTEQDKPRYTRTTLGTLKSVYRRGSGAYSTSFRPGVSRAAWSMARVNAFLYLLRNGRPANPKYVTDNDLLPEGHPKSTRDEFIEVEERQVNLTPPSYMRARARRGLELNRQGFGGAGLTDKTKQEAREMAAGRVSEDKWVRIAAWIARHLVDLDAPDADPNSDNYPSHGVVAHLLWGSGPSKRAAMRTMAYAKSVVERLEKEEKRHGSHDQSSHGSWASGKRTGKNLLEDKTLQKGNSLDNSLSEKATNFKSNDFADGKNSPDLALQDLAERQKFTEKPQVATSQEEYDAIQSPKIESGPLKGQNVYTEKELYRGFSDSGDGKVSASKAKNEFEDGKYYAGKGLYGNGTYATGDVTKAQIYAEGKSLENVSEFKLSPDSKIGSYTELSMELMDNRTGNRSLPESVEFDVGRYALAQGFDGYVVDQSKGDGVFTSNESVNQLVILNRTAIVLPPKG